MDKSFLPFASYLQWKIEKHNWQAFLVTFQSSLSVPAVCHYLQEHLEFISPYSRRSVLEEASPVLCFLMHASSLILKAMTKQAGLGLAGVLGAHSNASGLVFRFSISEGQHCVGKKPGPRWGNASKVHSTHPTTRSQEATFSFSEAAFCPETASPCPPAGFRREAGRTLG